MTGRPFRCASVVALVGIAWGLLACGVSQPSNTTPGMAASQNPTLPSPTAANPPAIATVTVDVPGGAQSHRLLLVEGKQLVVQEVDGQRRVIIEIESPSVVSFAAWSPDGSMVAFARRTYYRVGSSADWGDDILLVPSTGGLAELAWRHAETGEQVFGIAWRGGDHLRFGRIDLVTADDGRPIQIESAAVVELELATGSEQTIVDGGYDPSLSADGGQMAFARLEATLGVSTAMVGDAHGAAVTALAGAADFGILRYPRLAPDGTKVAFVAGIPLARSERTTPSWWARLLAPLLPPPVEAHGVPMDLWVADASTGVLTRVTEIGEDDPYAAWAPDSETLVFIGSGGLYEVRADGTGLIRVGEGWFEGQVAVAPDDGR